MDRLSEIFEVCMGVLVILIACGVVLVIGGGGVIAVDKAVEEVRGCYEDHNGFAGPDPCAPEAEKRAKARAEAEDRAYERETDKLQREEEREYEKCAKKADRAWRRGDSQSARTMQWYGGC